MSAQLRAEAQRFRVGWEPDLRQRLSQFGSVDRSRLDYTWCLALCRTTTLPLEDVTTVFRWGSPNVAEHRNPGDYAVRTVIKAAAQARSRQRHYPVTAGASHVPGDERAE